MITGYIYNFTSVAEVILSSDLPKWKKWLSRKLLPSEFWDAAPQTVATIPGGSVIGKISIESALLPDYFDVGE